MPEAMARRIRHVADREQISMAEVIRRAVSCYFEASPDTGNSARYERAAAAAGTVNSGGADLSTHHDRHFAEAAET